ncbi:MAG: DUF3623 family protein [Gemmatimonadales bacterium]
MSGEQAVAWPGHVSRPAGGEAGQGLPAAVVLVVLFWWLATGVIVAVERNDTTRLLGVIVATWLLVIAGILAARVRNECTPRGALIGFTAGALAWVWVSALFYGGIVVGATAHVPPDLGMAPSVPLAIRAVVATGWSDLLALATLGAFYLLPGRNPTAWHTLAVFWGVQQVAKVNVFFGVVNAGVRFLPERLAFLTAFFGPPRLTPLLVLSIAGLVALGTRWFLRARRAPDRFTRWRLTLLVALVTLAVLELIVLGIPHDLPLWDAFLRMRG